MFPIPIEKTARTTQWLYTIALPLALILWLLPLMGVAVTSIRSSSDLAAGNYFGMPSTFAWTNYLEIFSNTPMLKYMRNSMFVTLPTVLGAVTLSCMAGFALAVYKFKSNLLLFFMFVAGNFVPFQILMVPVRDLTVQTGLYNTYSGLILFHIAFQTGFCTLFMRNFIKGLPFELIESARVEGVSEIAIFWHIVLPAFALALSGIGQAARLTRANMVETYDKPYIEMATAFGYPARRIARLYAFKPSLIPSLTIIGLDFAAMLGNAFLVESVFAWPGLSRYGVSVILRKDLNAIIGTVLIISATFLIVNLIVDLMIAFLNPRIRHSQRGSS